MRATNVLIVSAHPSQESFCWALRGRVSAALEQAGAAVRHHDLYQEGFNPILTLDHWREHYRERVEPDELEAYRTDLAWADSLILIFPAWWYLMPAILKGYLDRVLTPGFAFQLKDGRVRRGQLSRIQNLTAFVSFGSPAWWNRLVIGLALKRVLCRGLRPLLAARCRTRFRAIHDMDRRDEASRQDQLAKVERDVVRMHL